MNIFVVESRFLFIVFLVNLFKMEVMIRFNNTYVFNNMKFVKKSVGTKM